MVILCQGIIPCPLPPPPTNTAASNYLYVSYFLLLIRYMTISSLNLRMLPLFVLAACTSMHVSQL